MSLSRFIARRLAFLSNDGAITYHKRIQEEHGDQGLKDALLGEHTGMGIVAGLLATVTVSALLVNPEQRPENRYNDAARYCYVVFLILSTFFNLSAISISFEVYHTTLKIPLSGMLDFAASFKGSSRTEGYMHIYIGCYSLWCAIMAALYMLHGAGPFFIALGAAVAFVGHVTVLTNQLYNSLLRSFERHGKAGAHVRLRDTVAATTTADVAKPGGGGGTQHSSGVQGEARTDHQGKDINGQGAGAGGGGQTSSWLRGPRVAPGLDPAVAHH